MSDGPKRFVLLAETMNTESVPLEVGYTFPPFDAVLDRSTVAAYLDAVGENHPLYSEGNVVPPTAIAALVFGSLAKQMGLPPGTIHISQEFEFRRAVAVNDRVTMQARISGKRGRGKFALMVIDLEVTNKNREPVLSGKTTFLLPDGS